MTEAEREAAEQDLATYRQIVDGRNPMVRRAIAAGVSKHRVHALTGIARTTIDRILTADDTQE